MIQGIDVSEHQGIIDWNKVKASGIKFAILRAGYGNNNIDKQFRRNISECARVGMPIGIYWFSYALNIEMARREAQHTLNAIKGYTIQYPIYFDFEYDSVNYCKNKGINVTKNLATQMTLAFCGEIERQGYYAGNYTNQDYAFNVFNMEQLKNIDTWYAYYNSNCNRNCGMWQYSSNGRVPGINDNYVDMNYAYKDYPTIIKNMHNSKTNKEVKKKMDIILYLGTIDKSGAEYLQEYLKLPILSLEYFNANPKLKENAGKIYLVGGNDNSKPTKDTILISGSNRYTTVLEVINYIRK